MVTELALPIAASETHWFRETKRDGNIRNQKMRIRLSFIIAGWSWCMSPDSFTGFDEDLSYMAKMRDGE